MAGVAGDAMPKRCLICCLLSVLASLIGQSRAQSRRLDSPLGVKTCVRQVIFENAGLLSAQERKHLTEQIRQDGAKVRFDQRCGDPSDVADLAEERVRAACQDDGYSKADVSAVAKLVPDRSANRQFDIVIKILRYGLQYSLGEIHFANAKVFSEAELFKVMPIRPGEIFSRARVAEGLEGLQRFYQSAEYVNFTSIPNTEFDEANASIRLTLDVDEGKLFRWGELRVTGLDAGKTQSLTDAWEALRGKPYSPRTLQQFCAKVFPAVPIDTDPALYTSRILNEGAGTVDISIEFVSPWWISD
jgi:outer membrane translocation and assembly module TamA